MRIPEPPPPPRFAKSGRPLLQDWIRMKAERGQIDEVVRIVAALEEILQDISDGKAREADISARSWIKRELISLRREAKMSLGE